ncbi:MAG: 3-isopropylmalate dehydrogenase [Chloroflexota bacterium]
MEARIVALPGDGIGPEVTEAALAVLEAVGQAFGHTFEIEERLLGGCAIDETGEALPEETREACLAADAVLLGAVGGPKWDDPTAAVRPEQGLLGLRKTLGLYANLRPVTPHPSLLEASPLRPERLQGVDLLVLRELTGGIYFGQPQERREVDGEWLALDTMVYREHEIARIAHLAFRTARGRRGRVTSVDKANVLESSRLWRQTVETVAQEYPDVTLEHLLVDAAAMHLLSRPASFDVVVTANLFGDILTDEASMLTGSMGNLPSASLGEAQNGHGCPRGLYEPIHGSAPDIAGEGIANPVGTILSLALLLRHSLGLEREATAVEAAVERALLRGHRTMDLAADGERAIGTREMTAVIVGALGK